MKDNEAQLGDIVKDKITGYTGVVIGVTQWLYGCRRISVQSQEMKDGKPMEHCSFDEPQMTLVRHGAIVVRDEAEPLARTGGPRPEVSRVTAERR